MNQSTFVTKHLLSLLFFVAMPSYAYSEDFRPLRIQPMVKQYDYDYNVIQLNARYRGQGGIAANQKLNITILDIGKLPETEQHLGGINIVAQYDETQASIVIRTEIETDENGNAEIRVQLKQGRYQIIVSSDGQEGTGWKPLRIPITSNAIPRPSNKTNLCQSIPLLVTETERVLYKSGEEIHFRILFNPKCFDQYSYPYFVEINDGMNNNLIEVNAQSPQFKYKSEREGTFPVNLKLSPKYPASLDYSIFNLTPSVISIKPQSSVIQKKTTLLTVYYFKTLIEPNAHIIDNIFTTQVQYEVTEEARSFDLVDLKLQLCVPNTNDCFMADLDSSANKANDIVTFSVPTLKTGPMNPTLFIGDMPYDKPLPEITLPVKTARNIIILALLAIIFVDIFIWRRKKIHAYEAQIPPIPSKRAVPDNQHCRDYIRLCFESVAKRFFTRSINWEEESVKSYYLSCIEGKSDQSSQEFEQYCFYIHSILQQNTYTAKDLENVRQNSLKLLK